MKIKNNDKWKRSKSALKDEMMFQILDPDTRKYTWFNVKYPVTIYETPKNYKYSLTLNDGNWLRFPTEYRTMNGKPKAHATAFMPTEREATTSTLSPTS